MMAAWRLPANPFPFPFCLDKSLPQLVQIKYSTCQVVPLDKSCSQGSPTSRWLDVFCAKKGKPCLACTSTHKNILIFYFSDTYAILLLQWTKPESGLVHWDYSTNITSGCLKLAFLHSNSCSAFSYLIHYLQRQPVT